MTAAHQANQTPRAFTDENRKTLRRFGLGTGLAVVAIAAGTTFLDNSANPRAERAVPDIEPTVQYLKRLPNRVAVTIPTGLGSDYAAEQVDPVAFASSPVMHDALKAVIEAQSVGGEGAALQAHQTVEVPVVPVPAPHVP